MEEWEGGVVNPPILDSFWFHFFNACKQALFKKKPTNVPPQKKRKGELRRMFSFWLSPVVNCERYKAGCWDTGNGEWGCLHLQVPYRAFPAVFHPCKEKRRPGAERASKVRRGTVLLAPSLPPDTTPSHLFSYSLVVPPTLKSSQLGTGSGEKALFVDRVGSKRALLVCNTITWQERTVNRP